MPAKNAVVGFVMTILCLAPGAPAAAAEATLRIDGVPNRLVLPLKEGENRVLTATVSGAAAKSVWLAKTRDSRLRLYFQKAGANQFQLNLADSDVLAVLEAARGKRTFRVFAETAEGEVVAGFPINYTTGKPDRAPAQTPTFYLISTEKDAEPREIRTVSWQTWQFPQPWFDTDKVAAIEARFKSADSVTKAQATIGQKSWTFAKASKNTIRLKITPEIAQAWRREGALWLGHYDERWTREAVLLARPKELQFKAGNLISTTVYQREAKAIPGSNDYLIVHLGDITHGQVLVTVHTAEADMLIDRVSLRRGDRRTFDFGGQQYVLTIHKMVNLLIGNDWAEVEISRVAASEQAKIEALLRYIVQAKVTFIREGKEHKASEAADHLRKKYGFAGPRIHTVEEFIDKIASRSSLTGKLYRVRLPDGKTVETGRWLHEAVKNLNREPPKKTKSTLR